MAKPISPRWSNAAAASLSSRIIRAGIPLGSWPASIGVCGASPLPSGAASPSIGARNLPLLRHCETGSASPAISACRPRPGRKVAWKIAMDGYGASCPPTHCAAVGQGNPQAVADRLNSTALQCLGYRTPHKVVGEQIALLKPG